METNFAEFEFWRVSPRCYDSSAVVHSHSVFCAGYWLTKIKSSVTNLKVLWHYYNDVIFYHDEKQKTTLESRSVYKPIAWFRHSVNKYRERQLLDNTYCVIMLQSLQSITYTCLWVFDATCTASVFKNSRERTACYTRNFQFLVPKTNDTLSY